MNDKIEFCKTCTNRSFSSSKGIVCGLTNEKPNFVLSCSDYERDIKEEKKIADRQAIIDAGEIYDDKGKPMPTWRIVLSVIIFLIVIARLAMRCSKL
ncbi:hypothetical protein [Kordia sp.]|uniref:hypothetical protein n=1 Tax=Kordia sp. TaxID=1965332 RepID=UPI003D6B3A61